MPRSVFPIDGAISSISEVQDRYQDAQGLLSSSRVGLENTGGTHGTLHSAENVIERR